MKFKDTKYGDLTGQKHSGLIYIRDEKLTSLEGMPKEVTDNVDIGDNKLTTLDFFPSEVGGKIDISINPLKSLKGLPKLVFDGLFVSYTDIKTLEGFPLQVGIRAVLTDNPLLESLYTGNKLTEIGGIFNVQDCPKLKHPKQQIIENQIKADTYATDDGHFTFKDIEKDFNAYLALDKRVHSNGFRSLLGLKK